MPQFARPSADTLTTGWVRNSGSADFYTYLDESVADDGNYLSAANSGTPGPLVVKLSSVTDPVSSSGHVVRFKYSMLPELGIITGYDYFGLGQVNVQLRQGYTNESSLGTLIAQTGLISPSAFADVPSWGFVTGSLTLDGGEADSITDYSDLYLRFVPDNARTVIRYQTPGTGNITLPGSATQEVIIYARGPGGGGGGTTNTGGGGGGGGGVGKRTRNITGGVNYPYTVGAGGVGGTGGASPTDGTTGDNTTFENGELEEVSGDAGFQGSAASPGGAGGSGIGDTSFTGGNGEDGEAVEAGLAGAGGGGAGTTGNGGNGASSTGGTAGTNETWLLSSGSGGNAVDNSNGQNAGAGLGGGGAGGSDPNGDGGDGGNGAIEIDYQEYSRPAVSWAELQVPNAPGSSVLPLVVCDMRNISDMGGMRG